MKNLKYILFALLALVVASCDDSNADYSDVVYITGTMQRTTIRKGFEGNDSVPLTVTSTAKVDEPITATFEAAPDLLDAYNAKNNASYVAPPASAYSIKDGKVTIKPGSNVSTTAKLMIADPSQFEEGKNYCLPVRIHTDGNLLDAGSVAYIVFVPIITTDVADINGKAFLVPGFRNNEALGHLSQLTMECKVYVNEFQHNNPYISTLMGCEENFLLRFSLRVVRPARPIGVLLTRVRLTPLLSRRTSPPRNGVTLPVFTTEPTSRCTSTASRWATPWMPPVTSLWFGAMTMAPAMVTTMARLPSVIPLADAISTAISASSVCGMWLAHRPSCSTTSAMLIPIPRD